MKRYNPVKFTFASANRGGIAGYALLMAGGAHNGRIGSEVI